MIIVIILYHNILYSTTLFNVTDTSGMFRESKKNLGAIAFYELTNFLFFLLNIVYSIFFTISPSLTK